MAQLHTEISKGVISKEVLAELEDRFILIESNLHAQWADSKANDAEARENAWLQLNALQQLRNSFIRDINTGKLAEQQLKNENAKAERINNKTH